MEDIKGIVKTLEKQVGVQNDIQNVIKMALSWRMLADMEARMTASSLRARDVLRANFLYVPAEKEDRDALWDYARSLSQLSAAVTVTTATAAERYRTDAERVLANPFVQDEFLRDAARWTTVVALRRSLVLPASLGDAEPLETPCRKEARRFLDAYDLEAARCAKVVTALATRTATGGTVTSSWQPVCEYTRARIQQSAPDYYEL